MGQLYGILLYGKRFMPFISGLRANYVKCGGTLSKEACLTIQRGSTLLFKRAMPYYSRKGRDNGY